MSAPTPDYLIAHAVGNMGITLRSARHLIRVFERRRVRDPAWGRAVALCEDAMRRISKRGL